MNFVRGPSQKTENDFNTTIDASVNFIVFVCYGKKKHKTTEKFYFVLRNVSVYGICVSLPNYDFVAFGIRLFCLAFIASFVFLLFFSICTLRALERLRGMHCQWQAKKFTIKRKIFSDKRKPNRSNACKSFEQQVNFRG